MAVLTKWPIIECLGPFETRIGFLCFVFTFLFSLCSAEQLLGSRLGRMQEQPCRYWVLGGVRHMSCNWQLPAVEKAVFGIA